MGKDREGRFHPKKGKPSGGDEGIDRDPRPDAADVQQDLTDTHFMHPNRNTNKKQDQKKMEKDDPADKTVNETYKEEFDDTVPRELSARLSVEEFRELAAHSQQFSVTIYQPTYRKGVEVNEQQDLISFKNNLQEIAQQLSGKGVEEVQIKRMLKPGFDLLRNEDFWHNLTEGLAVFIADGRFDHVKLPYTPVPEIFYGHVFMVSPLIKLLMQPEFFYLLTLSKKQVKLYRADSWGMQEIVIPEMPEGIDDVVHFEEKDNQRLFRAGSGGKGGASYHGTGSGQPDDTTNVTMYLDEVEETLMKELLHNSHAPLLLAGPEYIIPIFRSVTSYRYVREDALVQGGLEHEPPSRIYELAMEKMQPYFLERRETALRMYFNQSATPVTSSMAAEIIPAAFYGQVSHLFMVEGMHIWGRFNEEENKLEIHTERQEGDDCLMDKAAVKTITMGGDVFMLPADKMPAANELAAVLRFPLSSET